MYGTCVFHMIAAITTNISANATTIIKLLFSDRTPIEIKMMVEIDFHSISNLVSTYMKAMASYANILRISTHVPPPKDVCVGGYIMIVRSL